MITFTPATWAAILAQPDSATRAQALATLLGADSTIEFLDAADAVIRTVTTGAWSVAGANALPGTYTDAGTGGGTPATAVFKAGATEIMRMTCGTLAGADYRLLANIVAGVPIRRGPFAVLFLPPPEPGTSQPSVVTAPTISGVAKVGQVITATPGVYAGNPVPTVARQWYSGATAISGAAGLTITVTDDELGGIITFVETPSNSVGSITVTSNALGPVGAADLNADAIPATIQINQGGTFDLTPYVVGGVPPYSAAVAVGYSLPTGVTQTGPMELSAAIDAPLTDEPLPTVKFDIDDSAPSVTLPTFGVLSHVGGADLPFAAAHVFKQGDVPSGSFVDSNLTDWQCTPVTRWPDGSLKHAIIAGRATCSVQVLRAAQLSVAGTARAGTALTPADLAAALPAVTVQGGSQVITLNDLVATPHRTVLTGPVMSQWVYRAPVPGSNHLVVLFELRLYKGGRVELFPPKVENGYLLVPGGAEDTRTWTLTIGGVVQYSAPITIKYASNVHLLDNSASSFKHFSYWIGGDPQIEPRHDTAYLQSTGAVPAFGWSTPSEATLNGLQQSYTPNTLVGLQGFAAGGNSAAPLGHRGNKADALYAISADARAYRGMMALAMSSGSWSVHRRDETTNEPIAFSSYPLASLNTQNTPVIPSFTGGVNGFLPNPTTSHQPTFAYLAWLMTGRWAFLDEIKFWATNNYLWQTQAARNNADGRLRPDAGANTDRGSAWGLRTLAQLLFSLPTELPSPRAPDATFAADILNSWEKNVAWFHGAVITGTEAAGAYVNDLGLWPGYYTKGSSVYTAANGYPSDAGAMWNVAGWMQMMLTLVWGYTWDMDLPASAGTKSQHQAIRDHGYKLPVGLAGAGDPNEWNYRWFGPYDLAVGLKAGSTWFADWNEAYDTAVGELGAPPADNTLLRTYSTSVAGRWGPTPDVYLTSFFGQHHAALAYAVEHGAPGASAAWARITAATNYAEYTAGFADSPSYGIVPRSA